MIAALVNQERSLVVRDGGGGAASGGGGGSTSLPSIPTLQRMDVDELRAVLASHGVGGKKMKGMSKRQMLDLLEDKVYKNDDDDVEEVKLLTIGGNGGDCGRKEPAKKRRKKEAMVMDSDDDDNVGSDGDWNPDA